MGIRVRDKNPRELMRAIDALGEMKWMQTFFADAAVEASRLAPGKRDRVLAQIALARPLIVEEGALEALLAWKGPAC
jgi:hypothetical protein